MSALASSPLPAGPTYLYTVTTSRFWMRPERVITTVTLFRPDGTPKFAWCFGNRHRDQLRLRRTLTKIQRTYGAVKAPVA